MTAVDQPRHVGRDAWAGQTARALELLPQRQSNALRLVYSLGLTTYAVAARMGIGTGEASEAIADGLIALGRSLVAAAGD